MRPQASAETARPGFGLTEHSAPRSSVRRVTIVPLILVALGIATVVTTLVWVVTRGARRNPDPDMWRPGHDPLGPEGWARRAQAAEGGDEEG